MSDVVAPSREDPAIASGSEALGGPAGRHMAARRGWWTPLRAILALAVVAMALGVLERGPCRDAAWPRDDGQQYAHACYSDIPHLYRERGFAAGDVPYLDDGADSGPDSDGGSDGEGGHPPLEYPVLTGAFMLVTAEVTALLPGGGSGEDENARAVRYYDVNAVALVLAGIVLVVATVRLAGPRRPWDAALLAASPVLALHATINWDLFAAALTALAMLAWARRRHGWAGVWLGLAIAAKLYPVVLLLPLALVCFRARRWRGFALTAAAAAATWAAVNVPVLLAAPEAWRAFYEFNADRGADFGSIWYVLDLAGSPVASIDLVTGALTLAAFAGIAVLALLAPVRPRLPQLAFLTVAAVLMLNKVWSPQYALWLLPLAVLARPRWRDIGIWQAGEVLYFFAVWYYLLGAYGAGLSADAYTVTVLVRYAALLWLVGVVVRDVLDPARDPVRAAGLDDPAGGVVDQGAWPAGRPIPDGPVPDGAANAVLDQQEAHR